jgi:triacylglycerol lipase
MKLLHLLSLVFLVACQGTVKIHSSNEGHDFRPDAVEGVILLHGLCRSNSSMEEMEDRLVSLGYIVLNAGYESRSGGITELSEAAVGEALMDRRFESCSKIHFVTHSLGGILVRSYFSRHDEPRLGRTVMLGPPNQGSEIVDRLGSWWLFKKINGPAGGELGTGNESLPNQLGPVDFELGVIAGDRSINWINSMMIRGDDDGKVSVEKTKVAGMKAHLTVHATHPCMMKNEEVIGQVLSFLKFGSFMDNCGGP